MISIDNKKMHDLIVEKDALVTEGRKISGALDEIEKKILKLQDEERKITAKVKVDDLEKQGNKLNDECQAKFDELQKIVKEIEQIKLAAIPKEMKDEHTDLMKKREELERDRNKIFLKVQKIKDKVVPMIQKHVKPLLKEFDDIETAKTKDGLVVINTFNHLEDFKSKFRSR
jgi:predicted  nucleic acid-binding Zn-ribbon protein